MTHLLRSLTPALTTTLRLAIITLAIHGGLELTRDALAQEEQHAYMPYAERSGSLADRVAELEYLLESFSREGETVIVSGANLQVVNGTGTTDGEANGLGNLIVGYNEERGDLTDDRSGSHMLAVGAMLNYSSHGGIVVGLRNSTEGEYSSVSGGAENAVSGFAASISGGSVGGAHGDGASISGGLANNALADGASVSGGSGNVASGPYSSVSGGGANHADGLRSSVGGGAANRASDDYTAVSGGSGNQANATCSSVSGGSDNRANGPYASVSGGHNNYATGDTSSVSGGFYRSGETQFSWAAGSLLEER